MLSSENIGTSSPFQIEKEGIRSLSAAEIDQVAGGDTDWTTITFTTYVTMTGVPGTEWTIVTVTTTTTIQQP